MPDIGGMLVSSHGTAASGTVDNGNPVKIGGIYTATPGPVATGQRTDALFASNGAQIVQMGGTNSAAPNDTTANVSYGSFGTSQGIYTTIASQGFVYDGTTIRYQRGDANGTVTQPALSSAFWNYAPPVGGINNSTTAVMVKAAAGAGVRNYIKSLQLTADALGAGTEFVIRDGAAGTVLARVKVGTGGLTASGTTIFDPPLRGTANTLVEIATVTATVTGGVFANLQGYTGT